VIGVKQKNRPVSLDPHYWSWLLSVLL